MASLDLSLDRIVLRPLTLADHAASVAVECAAFTNPDHRASPDKLAYRLTVCPEVSLGLFVRPGTSTGQDDDAATLAALGIPPDADGHVLVGHIVCTRCRDPLASDASMRYPADWRTATTTSTATGHDPVGPTVALHSLAVVPAAQHHGVGSRLLRAHADRMATLVPAGAGLPPVTRIAIICQDYLVDYYKARGFALVGPSIAQFGGGGWYDMVYDLSPRA